MLVVQVSLQHLSINLLLVQYTTYYWWSNKTLKYSLIRWFRWIWTDPGHDLLKIMSILMICCPSIFSPPTKSSVPVIRNLQPWSILILIIHCIEHSSGFKNCSCSRKCYGYGWDTLLRQTRSSFIFHRSYDTWSLDVLELHCNNIMMMIILQSFWTLILLTTWNFLTWLKQKLQYQNKIILAGNRTLGSQVSTTN